MEPNKFEKHIREQLMERKIAPAPDSWDKVVRKLEASERPNRRPYYWAIVAAGFIGSLMVLGMFLKENSPASAPADKMVLSPSEQKEGQDLNAKEEEVLFHQKERNEMVTTNETSPESENKSKGVRSRPGPGPVHHPPQPTSTLALMESQILAADSTENIIALKVAEVVAYIEVIESEHATAMTDAEVDSLLLNAQRELMTDQMFPKSNKVDPKALLANVEEELDQSFRDQILEKLKSGFEKVRTAVAQRND
jgi:hypothetical protein